MGIADFFRPKYRHSDVRIRSEAVQALTADDAAILEQIARTDRDIGVRRLAIQKIATAEVLTALFDKETERSLRELINDRASELWTSRACGPDAELAGEALTGIVKLGEQRALIAVVVRGQNAAIRKRAFGELRDPRALAELAKSEAASELRTAAVARIDDGDVLRALAIDTTIKEIGLAAVERLDDVDRLENVANKAKNKAVRQKARKIVSEIAAAEAERNKAPGVPDEVKRRRAEKAQLIREVEAVADSFDFAKVAETVKAAEASWAALDGADEHDDKFTRAVARFWKRKELHDSQARSADELRAIEREARAAQAAAAPAPVAASAEPIAETDEARATREAEAQARQAERDQQRAEDEARRVAQAAEREARQAEEAKQAVELATSLAALNAEMAALATSEIKDGRAIDRLLARAGKAFDGIGKVAAAERDQLAEQYREVRGKLVIKASELREADEWLRWSNVPKAEALIETAKQMAAAEATADLGNRLRQMQALWKEEVGGLPANRSKELWDAFKQACDQVYDKVKGVRAVEHEKFAEITKAKEALIAEAEALADSTDFAATAERLKALQTQWKESGHLPRKLGDALWKKFRAACDKFFERRKPLLEARDAEERANLERKQALITRAQQIAAKAGEGTWGKAIGEIKDLQREWKEIGHVPRRDADTVWQAFRAACDGLFTKRDAARDAEANAHHAEIDALKAEIAAVIAGGDDVVTRAIAIRGKARDQGVLGAEIVAMIQHVVAAHPEAVTGTELDPAQLRARRDKLIARAEELLPKQAAPVETGDVAAQLKAAMRKNAFGDLRFSGRDPVEVVDELRTLWAEAGPILDDADRAQVERFEQTVARVLEIAGAPPVADELPAQPPRERRRRGERAPAEPVAIAAVVATPAAIPTRSPIMVVPDAGASAVAAITTPEEPAVDSVVPVSVHDAITQPARLPPEPPIGLPEIPAVVTTPLPPPPARAKSLSVAPPLDEVDTGWDLGDDDPTDDPSAGNEAESTPSSSEMAGDGSVEGDGLDQVD